MATGGLRGALSALPRTQPRNFPLADLVRQLACRLGGKEEVGGAVLRPDLAALLEEARARAHGRQHAEGAECRHRDHAQHKSLVRYAQFLVLSNILFGVE